MSRNKLVLEAQDCESEQEDRLEREMANWFRSKIREIEERHALQLKIWANEVEKAA